MELSALDASKCSIVSPHYQQQIANWQKQLKELDPQIKNVILTGDDDLDEFDKLENESFWIESWEMIMKVKAHQSKLKKKHES